MKSNKSPLDVMKGFRLTFNWMLFLIMIVLFVAIGLINSAFLNPNYIINVVLMNIIEIGLIALPMTLIIITGGIDLSVGSIMVLSAMMGGIAAKSYGGVIGLVVTLLTGLLCGFFNGFVITKLNVSPFITTLATMYLFMGLARGISLGNSVYSFNMSKFFGTTYICRIPMQIFIYIVFAVVFFLILSKTTLGRILFGIGMNENATKYSGIDIKKVKMGIYVTSGLVCALASLIWLGRFTSIKYDAGTNLNLTVVTVIVLGGTDILGGSGDIRGTIIGTLILAILDSGLTVIGMSIDTQTIVQGVVLIISLIVFAVLNARVRRSKIIKLDVYKSDAT